MKKIIFVVMLVVLAGCASNATLNEPNSEKSLNAITIQKKFAPQVWSGHKELEISEVACAHKGIQILSSLGFTQVVKSSHGEYIYGNYSSNRASIKCVSANKKTFMYAIVAGPEKVMIEKLRNEIMWQY